MGRSLMSRLVALSLKKQYPHKTKEEDIEAFEKKRIVPEPSYDIPESIKIDKPVVKKDYNGMQYFVVNEKEDPEKLILYVHGGAYRNEIEPAHWNLINTLVNATDAMAVVPLYHLIPYGDCLTAVEQITGLYSEYAGAKDIILAGDSSGGGLGLGLELDWTAKGIRVPDKTILISPWVDIRTNNPEGEKLQDVDPFLYGPSLQVCGDYWKGELPDTDYRVSPLLGDTSVLKNVTIFTGTREILYPDTKKLYEKIKGQEGCRLFIAEGMNHVYALLPVPEAKPAIAEMIKVIRG